MRACRNAAKVARPFATRRYVVGTKKKIVFGKSCLSAQIGPLGLEWDKAFLYKRSVIPNLIVIQFD